MPEFKLDAEQTARLKSIIGELTWVEHNVDFWINSIPNIVRPMVNAKIPHKLISELHKFFRENQALIEQINNLGIKKKFQKNPESQNAPVEFIITDPTGSRARMMSEFIDCLTSLKELIELAKPVVKMANELKNTFSVPNTEHIIIDNPEKFKQDSESLMAELAPMVEPFMSQQNSNKPHF